MIPLDDREDSVIADAAARARKRKLLAQYRQVAHEACTCDVPPDEESFMDGSKHAADCPCRQHLPNGEDQGVG